MPSASKPAKAAPTWAAPPTPPVDWEQLRFKHLAVISAVAASGSIGAAAVRLGLAQPHASQMLNQAESFLGIKLFDRSPRGAAPTTAGLPVLEQLLLVANQGDHIARQLRGRQRNAADKASSPTPEVLRLGVLPRVMLGFMPAALPSIRQALGAQTQFVVVEDVARELLRQLRAGLLDAVIARLVPEAQTESKLQLHCVPLYDESLHFVAATHHPMAHQRARPSLADLAQADWVLPPRGTEVRRSFDSFFMRASMEPPLPVVESRSLASNLQLACWPPLLTIAPWGALSTFVRRKQLKPLPLPLGEPASPISLICLKGQQSRRVVQQLAQILRHLAQDSELGSRTNPSS